MLNSQSSDKPEGILTSRIRDRLVARQKPGGGGWWAVRSKRTKIVVAKVFNQTNNEFSHLTLCCIRAIALSHAAQGIALVTINDKSNVVLCNVAKAHRYAIWQSLPNRYVVVCNA